LSRQSSFHVYAPHDNADAFNLEFIEKEIVKFAGIMKIAGVKAE